MQLTFPVITVIIGAMCTRTVVTEKDSHAFDLRPGSEGLVRRRRDAQTDSVVVFDRLQFTDSALKIVPGCRQSRQDADHEHDTAVRHH